MQELQLTWGQMFRIWWAIFWRWIAFANLFAGLYALIVGLTLLALGHKEWGLSNWTLSGIYLAMIPAAMMAFRIGSRAKFQDFRILILPPENSTTANG